MIYILRRQVRDEKQDKKDSALIDEQIKTNELIAANTEVLTNFMKILSNGGIAVNMDGKKMNKAIAAAAS